MREQGETAGRNTLHKKGMIWCHYVLHRIYFKATGFKTLEFLWQKNAIASYGQKNVAWVVPTCLLAAISQLTLTVIS